MITLIPMDAELRLIMVMVVVPVLFNCFQFWVQDNFLKAKRFPGSAVSILDTEEK